MWTLRISPHNPLPQRFFKEIPENRTHPRPILHTSVINSAALPPEALVECLGYPCPKEKLSGEPWSHAFAGRRWEVQGKLRLELLGQVGLG